MGELISHNVDLKTAPHLGNIPGLIAASRKHVANGSIQSLAEKLQLSRRTVNAWRSGEQIPQMEYMMRLCYCCGVPLYDLFTSPSGTLDLSKTRIRPLPEIPNPTGKRRHRTHFDTVCIQQYLEAALAQEEPPPPSMRTVVKHLNYSLSDLRKHFPALCQRIFSRRKDYFKSLREQRLRQWGKGVQQAIYKIHSQGSYPSPLRVGTR
jgi:transcriptional regulator with XRE-family HTH domain